MPVPLLSALEPPIPDEGFRALIDGLPVGLVWLDANGAVCALNEQAETLLSSSSGARVQPLIARLFEACSTTRTCIKTTLELSVSERLLVSVAPDRVPGSYVVVLDRQRLEKARTEASVLRAVLKAVASSTTREEALTRSLEAVHVALSASHLAFFELDPLGHRFSCVAWSGIDGAVHDAAALENDPERTILGAAIGFSRVITLADLSRVEPAVPFRKERGMAALVVPVAGRSTRGVLYVATHDVLGDSLLRLSNALADAIGAVLDLSTLEQEAARAREVAQQRDRLATIGQLVAGVAHEINNPLAFLKSNLHSLRSDLADLASAPVGEVSEIVSESLDGVMRIEAIVQALKGTARRKDEKVRFDPAKAIGEAVTIFRGAHKQDCDIDCSRLTKLADVQGSPSALGQVALNLMQNGLDAMSSLPRQRRKIEVSGRLEGETAVISFRDWGPGIPLDVQKRMFDAFFTTKDPGKGTGLGLAICKEIAQTMGGNLSFTTGSDGTCFELHLPLPAVDA